MFNKLENDEFYVSYFSKKSSYQFEYADPVAMCEYAGYSLQDGSTSAKVEISVIKNTVKYSTINILESDLIGYGSFTLELDGI